MVSARFAPFVGGTEIHTGEVAAELVRRGHDVTVLTTETTGSLPKEEILGRVRVVRVPAYPRRTDLYFAPGIRRIVRNGNWDLVHVQGYHTAVAPLALAAAQRARIPTVLTFHSGGHSSSLRNLIRPAQVWALRRLLLRCGALIAVSRFEAELFSARLDIAIDRIKVIPNGISLPDSVPVPDGTDPTAAADPQPTLDPDSGPVGAAALVGHGSATGGPGTPGPTILSMGRLVRYKGHHRVIKAMPYILRANPEARLLILGRGPYEKKLRRLARRLGVADRVEFDWVPAGDRSRLKSIMSKASMAVLLSAYESQGMAAHEAISVGLPLVVMDTTALSELVSAGAARAIPPQASHREVAEIVTRSLRSATESPAPPPGALPSPQTWPAIVDRLVDEYRRVATGGSPKSRKLP